MGAIGVILTLPGLFARQFRQFRRHTGNRMFVLIGLTRLMSWAEGLGIALFFPLFGTGSGADSLSRALRRLLAALHVPQTPTGALPFIVVAFALKGILQLVTQSYQGHLAAQFTLRLRRELVRGLRRLDYRAVVDQSAGFQANLLTNEVPRVGLAFTCFVRTFPPALNVVVFFGIVLLLDWRLTFLCVLMGLFAVAARHDRPDRRAHVDDAGARELALVAPAGRDGAGVQVPARHRAIRPAGEEDRRLGRAGGTPIRGAARRRRCRWRCRSR